MPQFAPDMLAACTGGRWTRLPASSLAGFTADSRKLRPGQVFVALRTDRRDGHAFLGAAQLMGASAAIVSAPSAALMLPQLVVRDTLTALQAIARAHRRGFSGPVIGVTGSAGKTSTKELIARLLGGEPAGVLATEGNLNNHLGVPLTLLRLDPAAHRFAIVEAGISAPGEMAVLASMIEPDVAIVTLVAPAHLAELGGVEGVAREKAILPASVRAGGLALFPSSCEEFAPFRDLRVAVRVIEKADVVRPETTQPDRVFFAASHREASTGISLAFGSASPMLFTLRRVSDGMAQNAALAIGAALHLGVTPEDVRERLSDWEPSPMRGEWHHAGGRGLYIDCYNANPAAMADALAAFCGIAPVDEARLFLLGCMEELGPDSVRYHNELGRALPLRAADHAIVIGVHAQAIREGALAAGFTSEQVEVAPSAASVRARVTEFRGSVFVKGSRRYELETAVESMVSAEAVHA